MTTAAAMHSRMINGSKVTATVDELEPGNGFFNPAFDVLKVDGAAFPRMVIPIQNMTQSSAAHALQLSSRWLIDVIEVDDDGRVWFQGSAKRPALVAVV